MKGRIFILSVIVEGEWKHLSVIQGILVWEVHLGSRCYAAI